MKDKDTPLKLVRMWDKMSKDVYKRLEDMRAQFAAEGEEWPEWCDMPINVAAHLLIGEEGLTPQSSANICAELTACYLWRKNKVVYWFDDTLAQVLYAQAQDVKEQERLPVELLTKLPFSCVYVKAPDIVENSDGFWAWLDYDVFRKGTELRMQWVTKSFENSIPLTLHILPEASIMECIRDTFSESMKWLPDELKNLDFNDEVLKSIYKPTMIGVQMLLYLTAQNSEIVEIRKKSRPQKKAEENSKKPLKEIKDEASEVSEYRVGVKMGRAIWKAMEYYERNPENKGTGKKVAPHMRRGHWHHYWKGPKAGKRELILRWTAPMMINAKDGATAKNVVIYPLKGEKKTED